MLRAPALRLWITVILTLLTGCQNHKVANPTPHEVFAQVGASGSTRYVIQPGDQLEVRFFHTPEQNAILPVRPDGYISLPLAPEVRAAGRTAEELRVDLQAAYGRELRDPQVAVLVLTFSGYKIHVGGQVATPGILNLEHGRNVLAAVFEAGGLLPTASPENIVIIRRDGEGSYVLTQVDLTGSLDGTDTSQNLDLRPYDLIFVPSSPIGNVNNWVDLYLRQNIPISLGWQVEI